MRFLNNDDQYRTLQWASVLFLGLLSIILATHC
jgi:hypothetical protein